MSLDEKFEIPIECRKCGNVTKQSLRRLEQDPIVTCPTCGATTEVTGAAEPANALRQVDEAWKRVEEAAKKSRR